MESVDTLTLRKKMDMPPLDVKEVLKATPFRITIDKYRKMKRRKRHGLRYS